MKINLKNSKEFYSGCKLGFQTFLPAAAHPVSKFLQLAAAHKTPACFKLCSHVRT